MVVRVDLQGRWSISAVNGRHVNGPWLDFGGEGIGTVTERGNSVFVASPQPRTKAFLGCNDWYPNGWARNGNKLAFGREMSRRTERGCDAPRMVLDDEIYAIFNAPMTMEVSPPNHLRLFNQNGTLELVRDGS